MTEKARILSNPKETNTANTLHEMLKKNVESISISEHSNISSPLKPHHFTDNGVLSLSFQDYGRESLGLLPSDFGRDTFLDMSILDNKEHTFKNILNISAYGRESLESGRESLGILQLHTLDVNFGDENGKVPEIMLTSIPECTESMVNVLDTAFLFPSPRKKFLSSGSSQNSGFPSFNSCSLEEPSKIYSLSKNEPMSCNLSLSEVFSTPSDLNNAKIITSSEIDEYNSVPDADKDNKNSRYFDVKCWSTGQVTKSRSCLNGSFHGGKLNFNEESENIVHDSIFIEGNHIAQKIADGSILNDDCGSNILDDTSQPNWPCDMDESNTKNSPKPESDTIFRTIDKMLPEPLHANIDFKLKSSKSNNTPSKSKDAKEILQNLSEILNNTDRSDQQKSQGQNLLSSLAEILCESSSSCKAPNLDDSGHSSIEPSDFSDKDKCDYYEVLDLSKKSSGDDSKKSYEHVLDLSLKKMARTIVERRLSQSFSSVTRKIEHGSSAEGAKKRNNSAVGLDTSNKNRTGNSSSSLRSNASQGSGSLMTSIGSKFRTKPGANETKKGPLKAVIPVKDMKRSNSNNALTPNKSQQGFSSLQSKRTSTPINEPKLKPMAASTPSAQNVKDPKVKDSSGVGQPKKIKPSATEIISKESAKLRTSLPSLISSADTSTSASSSNRKSMSKLEQAFFRRNGTSEIKTTDHRKLKRSNSLGKETGLMSSMGKVRENLLNSPYFNAKLKGALSENNNNVGSDVPGSARYSVPKLGNVQPKLRKAGKENVK